MQIQFFVQIDFLDFVVSNTANFCCVVFSNVLYHDPFDNWEQVIYLRMICNLGIILSPNSLYSVPLLRVFISSTKKKLNEASVYISLYLP